MTETKVDTGRSTLAQVVPYVAPLVLFMLFLSVQGFFPNQHYALYPVVTVLEVIVLAWFWKSLPSLTPSAPILSIVVGIAGVILWVGLDPVLVRYDQPLIGRNPFALYPLPEAWVLFGFRLAGIAVCVPILEELFWRGFLMRWIINEDFTSVKLGTFQPLSFWLTTAFFAGVHGVEWPLAVVVGIIYGVWFVRTKNLGNIMVAHGATNLLLALYCLFSNDWHFLSIVTPVPMPK